MKQGLLLLLLLLTSLVSALDFSVNCPEQVQLNQPFECQISLPNPSAYDVKLFLQENGKNIAKIWNPEKQKWMSSFYYLKSQKEFKETTLKAKITATGTFDGKIILRKSSKKYSKPITITCSESTQPSDNPKNTTNTNKNKKNNPQPLTTQSTKNPKNLGKIILGKQINYSKKPSLVYESKNFKALRYAPYLLAFFTIFLLAAILLKRQ